MTDVALTFVVPAFNISNYLRQCLDSLVGQSLTKKEVVIVNDGSTDSTTQICREYASRFPFVRLLEQRNRGLSAARNAGLEAARGEFVQFVDGDDVVHSEVGQRGYDLCRFHELDMLRFTYKVFLEDQQKTLPSSIGWSKFPCGEVLLSREYFSQCIRSGLYEVTAVLGPIRRSFLVENALFFTEGVRMEDHEFTLKCLTIDPTASVMQVHWDFYTYRRRSGSITSTPRLSDIEDILSSYSRMREYVDTKVDFSPCLRQDARRAVSALFNQLITIYGHLSSSERHIADRLIPQEAIIYCTDNAFSRRSKYRLLLFGCARPLVGSLYFAKGLVQFCKQSVRFPERSGV